MPGGTVGGRMAVTSSPRSEQRVGRRQRPGLAPAHVRDDRRRVAGPEPVDVGPELRPQGVALGRAQHPQCRQRGRGVGRRRRGGEDIGAGPVDEQVGEAPGTGDETTERAQRLRQRADAQHVDVGEGGAGDRGAQDRVGLVEHEERAVVRTHLGELVDRCDVAVHREHGLGDHDGPGGVVRAEELVDVGGVVVSVDRQRRARQAGDRR